MVRYGLWSPQACFCLPINHLSALWSTTAIPMWSWVISVRTPFESYARRVKSLMSLSLHSGAPHPLPYYKWYLPVGLLMPSSTCRSHLTISTVPTRSWEFFTNLDYEFSVIRGRRPYRWTIWVRSSGRCFPASRPCLTLGLNNPLV